LGIEQEKLESLVKEGFEWNNLFRVKMLQIFFLISTALYAFSLSGCVHNDLHYGNIYIEDLKVPKQQIFCINDKYYSITSQYKVYIYDFDRSYSKQLSNNLVLMHTCDALQCNEFYENLDIIKILCYMFRDYNLGMQWHPPLMSPLRTSLADELLDCIVPSSQTEIRNIITQSYTKDDDNRCFFMNIPENRAFKIDFFSRCNNMITIIDNLYKKFFSSSRPVKIKNSESFSLYVCHMDYFTPEGRIKDEAFVRDQYEKIKNTLLGTKKTSPRVRGRSDEEKSEDEPRPAKRSRSDGQRYKKSLLHRKNDGKKKSPKKKKN
jgi:hypothetical protein